MQINGSRHISHKNTVFNFNTQVEKIIGPDVFTNVTTYLSGVLQSQCVLSGPLSHCVKSDFQKYLKFCFLSF